MPDDINKTGGLSNELKIFIEAKIMKRATLFNVGGPEIRRIIWDLDQPGETYSETIELLDSILSHGKGRFELNRHCHTTIQNPSTLCHGHFCKHLHILFMSENFSRIKKPMTIAHMTWNV